MRTRSLRLITRVVEEAHKAADYAAGELLVSDIYRDWLRKGYAMYRMEHRYGPAYSSDDDKFHPDRNRIEKNMPKVTVLLRTSDILEGAAEIVCAEVGERTGKKPTVTAVMAALIVKGWFNILSPPSVLSDPPVMSNGELWRRVNSMSDLLVDVQDGGLDKTDAERDMLVNKRIEDYMDTGVRNSGLPAVHEYMLMHDWCNFLLGTDKGGLAASAPQSAPDTPNRKKGVAAK